jgi:hypothetical protein
VIPSVAPTELLPKWSIGSDMASDIYITSRSRIVVLSVDADTSTVIFALSLVLIVAAGWFFGP